MGAQTSKSSPEKKVQVHLTVSPKQHTLSREQQSLLRSLTPQQRDKIEKAIKVIGEQLDHIASPKRKMKVSVTKKGEEAKKKKTLPKGEKAKKKVCATWKSNKKVDPVKPVNPVTKRHVNATKRTAKTLDKACKTKK